MSTKTKNIWGLEKDPAIKAVLIMLQHKVGPNAFMLLDDELLSEKAVRIVAPNTQQELSAYLYNYAQREGRYGLDLEFPFLIRTNADDQTISLNDLTDVEALEKMIEHLEINVE